jgi:putative membrane protein
MPPKLRGFLQRWGVTTLAVLVASNLGLGIDYNSFAGLLSASLLLGIFNAFLRPILLLLSLPLLVVTLGLFTLVINALLLLWVGSLVPAFHVRDFRAAFWGALVISLVSMAVNALVGSNERKEDRRRGRNQPPRPPHDSGGPVIDV